MSSTWVSSNPLYQEIIQAWRDGLISVPPRMCEVCEKIAASRVQTLSGLVEDATSNAKQLYCTDCWESRFGE